MFTGKRIITPTFAYNLELIFPELNPEYLIKEECTQMLKAPEASSLVTGDGNNVNNGRDQNINSSADLDRLLNIIEKQQAQIDALIKILAEK